MRARSAQRRFEGLVWGPRERTGSAGTHSYLTGSTHMSVFMVIICDMKYEGHIIHGLYLFCECQGAEMHLRQIFRIPLQPDGSSDTLRLRQRHDGSAMSP